MSGTHKIPKFRILLPAHAKQFCHLLGAPRGAAVARRKIQARPSDEFAPGTQCNRMPSWVPAKELPQIRSCHIGRGWDCRFSHQNWYIQNGSSERCGSNRRDRSKLSGFWKLRNACDAPGTEKCIGGIVNRSGEFCKTKALAHPHDLKREFPKRTQWCERDVVPTSKRPIGVVLARRVVS